MGDFKRNFFYLINWLWRVIIYIIWKQKIIIVFGVLLYIGITLNVHFIKSELIDKIKLFGAGLQVLGAMTIVLSLHSKHLLFSSRENFVDMIKEYFKNFPLFKKSFTLEVQKGGFKLHSPEVELSFKKRPKENIKDVIRYFDEEVEKLNQKFSRIKKSINKETSMREKEMLALKNETGREVEDAKNLLKRSMMSSFYSDLFGVFSILIGVIYGTIPELVETCLY